MFKKSFTLIEVMVATGVLVAGILGVISSYFGGAALVETTKNVDLVASAASAKIEYIRSDTFESINDYHHQIYPSIYGDDEDILLEGLDYRLIVYVEDVYARLKKVTVVGSWRQKEKIIGAQWLFEEEADPAAYLQPTTRVVLTTLMAER